MADNGETVPFSAGLINSNGDTPRSDLLAGESDRGASP